MFRGTRVPIQALFDYLEGGETLEDFLAGFPTASRKKVESNPAAFDEPNSKGTRHPRWSYCVKGAPPAFEEAKELLLARP